ncbi:hypothetical protein L7F22_000609 [Adiantum nelumboides]|nr:hypothetical protein [Adiantum nelumboides]
MILLVKGFEKEDVVLDAALVDMSEGAVIVGGFVFFQLQCKQIIIRKCLGELVKMGKSGKLFKSLVTGVRAFKSPSKERPSKGDKDHVKKRSKDKCFGSLGKSASRNRVVITATAGSPEAIEIKCVQVESEKLKDVLPVPVAESFTAESHAESKVSVKSEDGVLNGNGLVQLTPTGPKDHYIVSDQEEWAASKIQAAFRCYSAQRAFRALRALVRLQAVARGHIVRRHASVSLRCVKALIRIQALVRGRRVRGSELGQLVQKHLQQSKQAKKKSPEGWVNSTATAQQLHAKVQVKHDAVTKRQRALVYAYSEQLNRATPKAGSSSGFYSQVDKSLWIWVWMDRWTAATRKGGSAAVISVEDCVPVTRNIEKGKSSNKGGKPPDNPRKERRKWGEHTEIILPFPERNFISEEYEESERLGTPKASAQKPILQSPTLSPSHLSPLENSNGPSAREISLPDVRQSATEMSPDMKQATSPSCMTTVTVASQPICSLSDTFLPTENGINHASGVEKSWLSENNVVSSTPSVISQVSPSSSIVGTTNGHAAHAAQHMGSDSPPKTSKESSLSASSFLPQEEEISALFKSLTTVRLPQENIDGFSAVTRGLPTAELTQDEFLSGMHQPDEIVQAAIADIDMHSPCEAVDSIKGDKGEHMTRESGFSFGINGHLTDVLCEPGDVIDEEGQKNDDCNHVDALSETNGGCDASVISGGARSSDLTKNPSSVGLKQEQAECTSPSLPSYMATTKSAKAKIRTLTSPKQQADASKPKLDSPKHKSDSPKTKADSPSQKPDSASKRRHSLSAIDAKVSPGTQKPAFHVRASSKGNFSSLKDLSTDNFPLPNGDSRRHGK